MELLDSSLELTFHEDSLAVTNTIKFWLPIPPVASCDWQKCMNPDMVVWFNLASIPCACCILYQFPSTNVIIRWSSISLRDTHANLDLWSKMASTTLSRGSAATILLWLLTWSGVSRLQFFENCKFLYSSLPFHYHWWPTINFWPPIPIPSSSHNFSRATFQFAPLHVFTFPSLHGYWKCRKRDAETGWWLMTAMIWCLHKSKFFHSKLERISASVTFFLSNSFPLSIPYLFISQNFILLTSFSSSLVIFITCSSSISEGCFYQIFNVREC